MSSREFAEWMAYYSLDPFGRERADLRAGIIAAAVVNSQRVKGPAARPADFMPDFGRAPRRQQTVEQMKAGFARALRLKGRVGKVKEVQ